MAGQTSNALSAMNHIKTENILIQGYVAYCNYDRTKKQVAGKKRKKAGLGLYYNVCKRRLRFFKSTKLKLLFLNNVYSSNINPTNMKWVLFLLKSNNTGQDLKLGNFGEFQ